MNTFFGKQMNKPGGRRDLGALGRAMGIFSGVNGLVSDDRFNSTPLQPRKKLNELL
jgi:hypothetical protein